MSPVDVVVASISTIVLSAGIGFAAGVQYWDNVTRNRRR